MDQIRTGSFIAALRKRRGLTQEALGEKLGVTNKTVSRWENGNYMPDIGMLRSLARELDVTVDELLAGGSLPDAEAAMTVDDDIAAVSKANVFSVEEKKRYFMRKWRRDHAALLILLAVVCLAAFIVPFILHMPYFAGAGVIAGMIGYGFQNDRMMAYVEDNIY